MKLIGKNLFIISALLLVTLIGGVSALAQGNLNLGTNASGSTSAPITTEVTGKIAEISSGGPVTVTIGGAELIGGAEFFRIDLSSARFSDLVKIHVLLLNPWDVGKVLNNPHAYLDVGVWYPDSGGSHILSDGTIVSRDESPNASAQMSEIDGNVLLLPGVPMQNTLYILASIVKPQDDPKGKPGKPETPGQEKKLFDLEFYCDVRMGAAP